MADRALPTLERWRPHRAGIRNVWEYDDQQFTFADGRLILRGPNGSGKSNALALLVPFVLEGRMGAAHMDPFGGGRSMKALLLGALKEDDGSGGRRYRHTERTGYVWVEFARPGHGGVDEHLTVGVGARATTQRDASAWFFLTDRRPGIDLDLAPGRVCHTRGPLAEELGAAAVVDTAEEHRARVDNALFGLGPTRFRNLLELIRVLRRPQLAGKLDLDHLSRVLSDGLPALDPTIVEEVAASFDDLESVHRDLDELSSARRTVDAFLPVYREYLRTEAARRAGVVLDAARAQRAAVRRADEARRAVKDLEGAADANAAARREADVARERAEQERLAVVESPAYRDAARLVDVEEAATRAERDAGRSRSRADEASAAAMSAADEVTAAERERAGADTRAASRLTETADAADAAGAAWTLDPDEAGHPETLDRAVRVMVRARLADCAVARAAERVAAAARHDHQRTQEAASSALARADERRAASGSADLVASSARDELRALVVAWAGTAPGLDAAGREAVTATVDDLGEPSAPTPSTVYDIVVRPRRAALAVDAARSEDRRRSVAEERSARQDERDAIAAEVDPGPDALGWRRADRRGRPGAPLWACCDFGDGLDDNARAGVEAALDAAGLLDAWIDPTGDAASSDGDLDSWLQGPGPVAGDGGGSTLAQVLVPVVPDGSGLDAAAVSDALGLIGLGALGVAVDRDGRFHLGPLHGRAAKPVAEFVGAAARAERRRRRLAELGTVLAGLDRRIEDEVASGRRVAAELEAIESAARSVPSATILLDRLGEARSVRAQADALALVAVEATDAEEAAARVAHGAERELHRVAGERSIASTPEGIEQVAAAVEGLRQRGAEAVGARRDVERGGQAAEAARERAGRASAEATTRADEHAVAQREAEGRRTRADTLRARLGPEAEEPLVALQRIDASLTGHREEERRLVEARSTLDQRLGSARSDAVSAIAAVDRAERERSELQHHLAPLRPTDVLWGIGLGSAPAPATVAAGEAPPSTAEVVPEAARSDAARSDPPTDPLAFARWLADEVGSAPAPATVDRVASGLSAGYKALLDDLRHGYEPSLRTDDGLQTVQVTSDTGTFPLATLAVALAEQEERFREYLTEGDRELFERHLLTRVSDELRRLLNDADDLVARVNGALAGAPTASGLRVELRWDVAVDDVATRRAVRLLRHAPDQLGSEDREALRGFFQQAIGDQRAEDPSSGYRAALEAALDYRSWHEFVPYMRTATGGSGRVTRARFKELSGGEQAVTLHLPLFAAAAAHYDRATPTAPRLIALDEAFAGIDEAMRGELMGLTVGFDLDVVMTGHELWGAYAQVPAVAIYDLLRRPPAEGVSALSLRWDGTSMRSGADGADREHAGEVRAVEPEGAAGRDGLF